GDEILGFGPGDATGVAHAVENDLASLGDGGFLARASRTVDLGEAEDWLDKDGGIGAAGRKGFELDDALELLVGDALAEAGRIGRWSGLTEDGLARGCGLDRGRLGRAFRGRDGGLMMGVTVGLTLGPFRGRGLLLLCHGSAPSREGSECAESIPSLC